MFVADGCHWWASSKTGGDHKTDMWIVSNAAGKISVLDTFSVSDSGNVHGGVCCNIVIVHAS